METQSIKAYEENPEKITDLWTDTLPNGVRKHNIWKPSNRWTSITYTPEINEEDRLIIYIAFNNLYYNSMWFNGICETPKIGIFVRNGFHFSGNETLPHITFQFRGYGNDDIDNQYYHASFDKTTKLIVKMTHISVISL